MNRTLLALLLLAGLAPTAPAQTATNSDAPPSVHRLMSGWRQIDITSDGPMTVDYRSNLLTYQKDVVVRTPSGQITCDYLVGKVRDLNHASFESIVATTNVVLEAVRRNGEKIHGTGSMLVYTNAVTPASTNEWIELTGDPYPVVSGMLFTNTGEAFIYDITNEKLRIKTPHTQAQIKSGRGTTNAPPPAATPADR